MRKYGKSAEKRLAKLAVVAGIDGKDDNEKANAFITWIEDINKAMNIRNNFAEIRNEDMDTIIKWAIKEANPIYPCPQVWKYKDFKEIVLELKA